MSEKAKFASKIGLVMATVGSAVGLGNVWRFPAETQANGGAAFLLVYVLCTFILGIPVMLGEFALGRAGRSDAVGVFQKLAPRTGWWGVGALSLLASYMILIFYMVVAGWTMVYFWQSITNGLYAAAPAMTDAAGQAADSYFTAQMKSYIATDWTPAIATGVIILANIGILICGVQKGIERLSNILMPILFIILVGLCCVTLSLDGAAEGLKYFLNPDFSKITPSVLISALGQTFFSLSLGMGILITYSSYYPDDTRLTRTSVIVSLMSLLVALLMGMIIFPAVKTFGLDSHSFRGTELIFVTLPEVFANMPVSWLWSSLFFLLLLAAAITSTVSIAEVTIAFLEDRLHMRRISATLTVLLPLFVLSTVCSLSMGSWSNLTIFGLTIFDFLDYVATNVLLPLVSIGVCIYIGWFAPKGLLQNQLTNHGTLRTSMTRIIIWLIRFIAPVLIAMIMIAKFTA